MSCAVTECPQACQRRMHRKPALKKMAVFESPADLESGSFEGRAEPVPSLTSQVRRFERPASRVSTTFSGLLAGWLATGCGSTCGAAHRASPAPVPQPLAAVVAHAEASDIVTFKGMCDASGAVPLGATRFAVADDEDNVLRVYDAALGGAPLSAVDISAALDLPSKRTPEADIEAATSIGDRALWLTSHGLSSSGQEQPSRLRFFATTAPLVGARLEPVGRPYHALLADMIADPALARFGLADAAKRAPKQPGGLNIEGMTRCRDGATVLIGFRNPVPQGKALLVPLLNPLQVSDGAHAQFGAALLLDLDGLAVRSLSLWRDRYLIMAGAVAHERTSRLFVWDGANTPVAVTGLRLDELNPEAFVARDDNDRILLLSDDGDVEIDGRACKKLDDTTRKQFRGLWVRLTGY